MNREIDKEKVAAHIGGLLAELANQQPQIDSELTLLYAGHRIQDGPMIDLYGSLPADEDEGYAVIDIALHEQTISLIELIAQRFVNGAFQDNGLIESLSQWCDDHLPSVEQMREESRMEALIDAAEDKKLYD